MNFKPIFAACVIAGSVTVWAPAVAQTPLPDAPASKVSLEYAVREAWLRAAEASEAGAAGLRATADQAAARSLWAASPSIELSHRTDRSKGNAGSDETEVGVAWPLWMPGQRDARAARANASQELAEAQTQVARLRVAGVVRVAAWRLASTRAEADAARSQSAYLQQLAEDVDRRVKAGDLARADSLAARAELLEADATVNEAVQGVLTARVEWQALTGLEQEPVLETPLELPVPPTGEHPEVRFAELTAEQARRQLDVVNRSKSDPPELMLSYRNETPGVGDAKQRSVGVGLRIPLGTTVRNAPLLAAATGEVDVAETLAKRRKDRQSADVVIAHSALSTATQQLKSTRKRAEMLGERVQLVDRSFKAGETPLPELLRTAEAAAQARAALARQGAAAGLAYAQLQQALGLLP